jgi:hypothetical protein
MELDLQSAVNGGNGTPQATLQGILSFANTLTPTSAGTYLWATGLAAGSLITSGTLIAVHPGTVGTPETWQTVTLDAGWSAGTQAPQYRLQADGLVAVRGTASHASVTANTNINSGTPIPAAYRPAQDRFYRGASPVDTAGGNQITTGGVFVCRANASFPATQILLDGTYSLGN